MATTKSMSYLDVKRALQFPATVMSGEFSLAVRDHSSKKGDEEGRKHIADTDVDGGRAAVLRNLLLHPDRLHNFKSRGRAEALICQHREVPKMYGKRT